MNERDEAAFKHFLTTYKLQWDLNQPMREDYDDNLEYFVGYRDEANYPLAYNMTFPQLLPRIMTMLSRMLEQIYQGGSSELVAVRPRKRQDVERAPRVAGLLNFQLENLNNIDMDGGSYMFHYEWLRNALSWGNGIAKIYWRREERISPERIYYPKPVLDRNGRIKGMDLASIMSEAPQLIYDAPYAEVIHNKTFVPHPQYKHIQQMPNVFCVYSKSIDHIKKLADKGIYRNIDDLGVNAGAEHSYTGSRGSDDSMEAWWKGLDIEGYQTDRQLETDGIAPFVDIIEGYGRYILPEDETPYEVGSGVQIKGKESDVIVHIGNYKKILSLEKNTYGKKPFFNIGAFHHPELFWDMGIIRLGKHIQEQYDTLANTRYQGALMQVNPMLQVRQDSDIPVEALISKPFGIIPVDEIDQDVKPLILPDVYSQTFREQEEFFKSTIEDMTGMYKYSMGGTPERQEHVGTIQSLQSMGESRIKLILMTMDYQGFQPMLKHMMLLNTWHLPDDFEARIITQRGDDFTPMFPGDIHPEYDFTARYTSMEPALGKHYKAQQLLQYYQIWSQTPWLQHHQFIKAIMEMMDFPDTDKYIKTPQQVQQEQQQMMQQQIEAEMRNATLQDQMASNSDERKLTTEIAKNLTK